MDTSELLGQPDKMLQDNLALNKMLQGNLALDYIASHPGEVASCYRN